MLKNGLQVDVRVVEPSEFGAALLYFTGSKDHNVRLRSLAREQGLKINEYGVFRGDERIGGQTEEEVYATLGLPWIPPNCARIAGRSTPRDRGACPAWSTRPTSAAISTSTCRTNRPSATLSSSARTPVPESSSTQRSLWGVSVRTGRPGERRRRSWRR